MIWLDLEGTVIDDLWNRHWLQSNIDNKIILPQSKFGIFTWGWFDKDDIDWDFVKLLETKLTNNVVKKECIKVITKTDCMSWMRNNKKWFWNKELQFDAFAEESFNEKFDKVRCFIEMFKHEPGIHWLFDDTIEDFAKINFNFGEPEKESQIFLMKV